MNISTKWLIGLSLIAIPSAFIVLLLQIVVGLAPMDWWIEYQSVEPLSDKILTGTKPRFVSKLTVRRPCSVRYSDVLFCKQEGQEKFVYTYEYLSRSYGKTVGTEENEWIYQQEVYDPGECYLKSVIILDLAFDIEKTQVLKSNIFSAVNKIEVTDGN